MPDGGLPDKTQSIVLGQTIEVSWKSLNDSVSDLWFTTLSSKTEGRKLAHLVAGEVLMKLRNVFAFKISEFNCLIALSCNKTDFY